MPSAPDLGLTSVACPVCHQDLQVGLPRSAEIVAVVAEGEDPDLETVGEDDLEAAVIEDGDPAVAPKTDGEGEDGEADDGEADDGPRLRRVEQQCSRGHSFTAVYDW